MPFTIGLGRNSPIPLEGEPKKYEGLIVRHGQWVRWASARKCPCVLSTNRPDPRCPKCRGTGWRYSFQIDEEDMAIEAQVVDESTIELPFEVEASRVLLIQDGAGTVYTMSGAYGSFLKVRETFPGGRGMVYVSVLQDRRKRLEGLHGVYIGHGVVQIGMLEYQNPWARIPLDILSVDAVRRQSGSSLVVEDFSVDKIVVNTALEEPDVGEALDVALAYMPPYRVAIVNQAISLMDQKNLQDVGGDAMAVFPFSYKVSEMDTITSWASTQVRKKILRKADSDLDTLPDLFVSRVLHLEDIDRTYTEGQHFVVWDRNTIRWIVDESARPPVGKFFSIEYVANATYRVMQQFPNIRASENKRFPQRVGVKLETGITGGDQV